MCKLLFNKKIKNIKIKLINYIVYKGLFYVNKRLYILEKRDLYIKLILKIYTTLLSGYKKRESIYNKINRFYFWL